MPAKPRNIAEYLASLSKEKRAALQKLRKDIKVAAPKAEETISYNMPGFRLGGMLVWFAGYKNHIGFYPKPSALKAFSKELSIYKSSKGAVQFPLDKPLPVGLITKMVKLRVKENAEKV